MVCLCKLFVLWYIVCFHHLRLPFISHNSGYFSECQHKEGGKACCLQLLIFLKTKVTDHYSILPPASISFIKSCCQHEPTAISKEWQIQDLLVYDAQIVQIKIIILVDRKLITLYFCNARIRFLCQKKISFFLLTPINTVFKQRRGVLQGFPCGGNRIVLG